MRAMGTAGPPLEKGRLRLLCKRDEAAISRIIERQQVAKCKKRSKGICELVEKGQPRCTKRVQHNHHMIYGLGRKNVGRSQMAESRIELCADHHSEIHAHVLTPNSDTFSAALRWERMR